MTLIKTTSPKLHREARLAEAARGTNALGTTLVEARPTMIDCGEHYLDRLSSPARCTWGVE
jgi:transcriptional regulator of acetoin/glycerol metabolism